MPFTYGQVKKALAQYAGRAGLCSTDTQVDFFLRQVFEHVLHTGDHAAIRRFCFNAVNGCFTAPYELETPLQVIIDGEVGSVWSKWYDFYQEHNAETCGYFPAAELREETNKFFTAYDLPCGGARVGALATACEVSGTKLIVLGKDTSGREVITVHKGQQYAGEVLELCKGQLKYTQVTFGEITGIVKDKTVGYVQLLSYVPETGYKTFLADYSPLDEVPSYRRFRITTPSCPASAKVSIIGRIRLKDHYADNDLIPFDNMYALVLGAQHVQAATNKDYTTAAAADATLQQSLLRESEHKRTSAGQVLNFYVPTSGGAIKNIV